MPLTRRESCKLLAAAPVLAEGALAEEALQPADSLPGRYWIGPDFWSNPLQDWRLRKGRMECFVSGGDRNLYLLTKELGNQAGDFVLSVNLARLEGEHEPLGEGFAGFRFGIRGEFDDYRDSAIYGCGLNAGVNGDGRLFLGDEAHASARGALDLARETRLELTGRPAPGGYTLRLAAFDGAGKLLAEVTRPAIAPRDIAGGLALVCSAGPIGVGPQPVMHASMNGWHVPRRERTGNWRMAFSNWRVSGSQVVTHPGRAFGPILWTMYAVHNGVLNLSAQMAPVEQTAGPVYLEVQRDGAWQRLASAPIDKLARNALLRVEHWKATADVPYRVLFHYDGRDHAFSGVIKRDPIDKPRVTLAALSCLNDFGFPHADLLASIAHFEPDLIAFQGDQIYERTGSYGIQRTPPEPAVLDFLRKWYLFGWAFRDLMRHTPTVCQTDDHDMYQGNIWGAAGRHAEGEGQTGQDSGGYLEPAVWVNTVQRCQTSHLPDPFDPAPVDQGIAVYYTALVIGGVSFAILEDRKWKSAPKILLPGARIVNGWAQNPEYDARRQGDVPGAHLYGERQLQFIDGWARDWRGGVWMKVALTQTLLANLATLPPPANTDAVTPDLPILAPGQYAEGEVLVADHDSNGWPQSGRNRALEAFRRCAALHVCGDQHLGSTMQYGVDAFNDAAFAFCSPALSNFFPRRWYPPAPGVHPVPAFPRNSGEYRDGFGNRMTVHAVFNPQQTEAQLQALLDRSPGFGIIECERATRGITIALWPRGVDPRSPRAQPAPGWPVDIHQLDNGWSHCDWELPVLRAADGEGRRSDFCVELHDEQTGAWLYTVRAQGHEFRAPVRHSGFYTARLFDPDSEFSQVHRHLAAVRKPSVA